MIFGDYWEVSEHVSEHVLNRIETPAALAGKQVDQLYVSTGVRILG